MEFIGIFGYHDQPLSRHCEQVQTIVRKANIRRAKKIKVDMNGFIHEYYSNKMVEFRGTKLNSVDQQIAKVYQIKITKEIGAAKRIVTIAANKKAKAMEKMEADELKFQAERIRRINEMFDPEVSACTQMSPEAQHESTYPPENSGDMDRMD